MLFNLASKLVEHETVFQFGNFRHGNRSWWAEAILKEHSTIRDKNILYNF